MRASCHNMGAEGMDVQQQILHALEKNGVVISNEFAVSEKETHQKVVGAIKSLESLGNVINVKQIALKTWECTDEGNNLATSGSHEARLFNSLPPEGRSLTDIKASFPNSNFALGAAMKNKWLKKEGEKVIPAVSAIEDEVQIHLKAIAAGGENSVPDKIKAEYKKRKLIKEVDMTVFEVSKGSAFTTSVMKQEAELTKEMIESGQWKGKTFKPFNFKSKGRIEQRSGYLHPLMQLRSEFRQIFLEMGFTEMPTNNYVESAFWNFDALFQPQQHPARDAHDTFYVAEPGKTISVPEDYLQKVKKTHSSGGYGSIGYQYDWSREEAHKNLLRTHTTAVSARMLYKLAQEGFQPVKFFSIDRVFRNETLDATHLAEFNQIEGVVADYSLSIKNLMGLIKGFFEKIGITKLRFKPAYNPYTEPSMEIFRPAMIMYGINNIRELVGPRVKMELILDNPLCTIDKFRKQDQPDTSSGPTVESLTKRQELILDRLLALQAKVANIAANMGVKLEDSDTAVTTQLTGGPQLGIIHDVVIYADPRRPPYSLRALANALSTTYSICLRVHCHSTVKEVSEKLQQFWGAKYGVDRSKSSVCLTLVWRQDGDSPTALMPTMTVSPLAANQVCGEHNIGRYLSRLVEVATHSINLYECSSSSVFTAQIDELLDQCHSKFTLGNNRERTSYVRELSAKLDKESYLVGSSITLADLLVLSNLLQLRMLESAPSNVLKWSKGCLEHHLCKYFI
ncbi:phenylalanine--tRNA ligase alpha subunit isoform X2 [Cherax quadricarinatus]|uniref:phenylalanine--tRNA ligase alpha subunit isoform X2 n=1 Tax=Cherax quadricarinatus TaxID=27406 RepID=UPI00387EB097